MMGVPTNWQQMRYCIVAALHLMGDEGPWWSAEVKGEIEQRFSFDAAYVDWEMTTPFGRAYHRAMESLQADRTVTFDDVDGFRLASWGAA